MGYQTTIGILNDNLAKIQDEPDKFIMAITEGMNGFDSTFTRYFGNTVKVIQSHHADDYQLLLSGGNCLIPLETMELKKLSPLHRKDVLRKAKELLEYVTKVMKEIS